MKLQRGFRGGGKTTAERCYYQKTILRTCSVINNVHIGWFYGSRFEKSRHNTRMLRRLKRLVATSRSGFGSTFAIMVISINLLSRVLATLAFFDCCWTTSFPSNSWSDQELLCFFEERLFIDGFGMCLSTRVWFLLRVLFAFKYVFVPVCSKIILQMISSTNLPSWIPGWQPLTEALWARRNVFVNKYYLWTISS